MSWLVGNLISINDYRDCCYGVAMVFLWCFYGVAMVLLWCCYGVAMVLLWCCYDVAKVLLWCCYGVAKSADSVSWLVGELISLNGAFQTKL